MKCIPILSFLFIVFLQENSRAQTVQWSAPLAEDKKYPYLQILGTVEQGYYLLRSNIAFGIEKDHSGFKSRKYLLQLINDNLQVIYSQPLAMTCDDCRIADVGIIGNDPAVLYTSYDKSRKLMRVFLQRLDDHGKFSGTPLLLMEIAAEKSDDEVQPDLIYSQDEN